MLIPPNNSVQDFKILVLFTPLPTHLQLNHNTNTKRVNSLNIYNTHLLNIQEISQLWIIGEIIL